MEKNVKNINMITVSAVQKLASNVQRHAERSLNPINNKESLKAIF
ncbi:hypothetical protein QY96_03835 [Bacillus thermotolerans]|uniref:Uncharacterized protein n=1 Tax=Bacillus thermotolerans TaxID=1221996 RepID=A0A0F5HP66_BACTR|nr:hypothetical protein QY95_03838 [Bacillus thermotolerans]KKB34828.1 hypothetical protein QY96_03835 [Bacillus thermotolerans]